jgi:hypothetical protein
VAAGRLNRTHLPPDTASARTNTNAYGEPCEPGQGYTEQSGWWDPDRGYWRVHAHQQDVTPDVYSQRRGGNPARWLADRVTARLGGVESFDSGRTFYGSREAVHPGRLAGARSTAPGAILGCGTVLGDAVTASRLREPTVGQRLLSAAAHAHGFTDEQLAETAQLLGLA